MIPRRQHQLLFSASILLFAIPAQSCGPDWPEAVFVKRHGPDNPYAAFAAGRLGVLQPGYRDRHLAIAYDYLTEHPLTTAEQQEAVTADRYLADPWSEQSNARNASPGYDSWTKARSPYGTIDGYSNATPEVSRRVPGEQYQSFTNCLDDAFATAAHTLADRVQTYGPRNPNVIEWIHGQDIVFANCNDGSTHSLYGQTQPAPPPPRLPALQPTAPLWLQQDRAYQLAAASFYATDFDTALAGFRLIAADKKSPWSVLSRYLVARTLVRTADLILDPNTNKDGVYPAQQHILQARTELLAMRSESRMSPMLPAIESLLDHINSLIDPSAQSIFVASRLQSLNDPRFGQDLIDLSLLHGGNSVDDPLTDAQKAKRSAARAVALRTQSGREGVEMLQWIEAVQASDERTSLRQWHETHQPVWLLAAISFATPSDPETPNLIAAAKNIAMSDPAYVGITYHRLRLSARSAGTRADLLLVLPNIDKLEGPSTRNLFATLNAATAPDFTTWLSQAGRVPASEILEGDENNDPESQYSDVPPDYVSKPKHLVPLFTPDAATILNTRLPLNLLAAAAENPSLAPNLRYQIAQATWTRAVLLDKPAIARRMSPILIATHSAWKLVLDAYDHATTADNRKAAGLFALMRFASTEPNVREGDERFEGFAKYSYYRDNWWCYIIPPSKEPPLSDDTTWGVTTVAHPDTPDPLFLTPEDRKEYASEAAILGKIPMASHYFAEQAFTWQAAHPRDPRTPELLGQAFRVERNACGDKESSEIAHKLFLILHFKYPTNHWTLRYKSWD